MYTLIYLFNKYLEPVAVKIPLGAGDLTVNKTWSLFSRDLVSLQTYKPTNN